MKLVYRPQAVKQLLRLSPPEKQKVVHKLEQLALDPLIGKTLRGEFAGLRSLRAWPYRIIYESPRASARASSFARLAESKQARVRVISASIPALSCVA